MCRYHRHMDPCVDIIDIMDVIIIKYRNVNCFLVRESWKNHKKRSACTIINDRLFCEVKLLKVSYKDNLMIILLNFQDFIPFRDILFQYLLLSSAALPGFHKTQEIINTPDALDRVNSNQTLCYTTKFGSVQKAGRLLRRLISI